LLGKYGNAIIEKLNLTSFGQKKNTIWFSMVEGLGEFVKG
jgi:hypothetical protein